MLHLWKGVIDSHLLGWISLRACVDIVQTGVLFQPGGDHLQPDAGFLSSQKVFHLLDMEEGIAMQKNGSLYSRLADMVIQREP
jgi:hypothetical protein